MVVWVNFPSGSCRGFAGLDVQVHVQLVSIEGLYPRILLSFETCCHPEAVPTEEGTQMREKAHDFGGERPPLTAVDHPLSTEPIP